MNATASSEWKIRRNVGGVPGVHVLLNAFSEETEKALFESKAFFRDGKNTRVKVGRRAGWMRHHRDSSFPLEVYKLTNLVRDSELYPEMLTPDNCYSLTYTDSPTFQAHFDSRCRWGETVVGVSLGAMACLYFYPAKGQKEEESLVEDEEEEEEEKKALRKVFGRGLGATRVVRTPKMFRVEIELPRRSIYVMSGASRIDWTHGISEVEKVKGVSFEAPDWNPAHLRRSLTLRADKWYSNAVLRYRVENAEENLDAKKRLKERLDAQLDIGDHPDSYWKKGKMAYTSQKQAAGDAKEMETNPFYVRLASSKFTDAELGRSGVFQGVGRVTGTSGASSVARPRKRDDAAVREARLRRFERKNSRETTARRAEGDTGAAGAPDELDGDDVGLQRALLASLREQTVVAGKRRRADLPRDDPPPSKSGPGESSGAAAATATATVPTETKARTPCPQGTRKDNAEDVIVIDD